MRKKARDGAAIGVISVHHPTFRFQFPRSQKLSSAIDRCYFRSGQKCHGGQIFAWQHCRISTNDEFDSASAKSGSTPANEQQKMWETYYGAFNKMEPHGNLQLHPNHPGVYSVSDSRSLVLLVNHLLSSSPCGVLSYLFPHSVTLQSRF